MEFDAAKAVLRDGYLALGFKLIDEHVKELYLQRDPYRVAIRQEEIQQYAEVADTLETLEQAPHPTSIVSHTYREQLLEPSILFAHCDSCCSRDFYLDRETVVCLTSKLDLLHQHSLVALG